MKIVRNLFVLVLLFGIGYFLVKVSRDKGNFIPTLIPEDSVFKFPNLVGPMDSTVIKPMHRTSWKKYATGEGFGIAVLLTDTSVNSNWLGIVHAFKSFGIPFRLYTNVDSALQHDVVYVYPTINASMDGSMLAKLAQFPQKGGTLIGQDIEGGLSQVFGFTGMYGSTTNFKIQIKDINNPVLKDFTDSKEREISLGNPETYKECVGTYGYIGLFGKPLMAYPNGQAFMTERDYPGGGRAYAFGTDLGFFTLMCHNEMSYDAFRTYVNSYEPTLDVLIRIVKNIYISGSKTAITLGTVQDNKKLTVCITHDIDYSRSMFNSIDYAKLEKSRNVTATYFIQTKYIHDWNDDAFYNDSAIGTLKFLDSLKMEVASHSVSHSRMYKDFPMGKGNEKYPSYHPVVHSKFVTSGGTVIGELRVSKFLLENFIKDQPIVSFRPGHLSLPFSLPQALEGTGFKYSSDVTANDVLTHMPYQMNYNRNYDEEMPVFEFPITIEDEELPEMDKRLDSAMCVAHKISKYGGLWCTLIHPNITGFKYKFEVGLLDSLQGIAHITTMRDFGDWWAARNNVRYYIRKNTTGYELHITTPAPMSDLTFFVPPAWVASPGQPTQQTGNSVLVKNITNGMTINFTEK
ncbi:MAG TPA: hypothetical protein VK808_06975 [Bacteroidia bacterium]|jgi:hypothetical protein|nr:hypothetical protein [Bacteroidia bacterium]